MGKVKENFKKHQKVFLIALAIILCGLAALGITLGIANRDREMVVEEKEDSYVVYVKDVNGATVQGASLMLYSEDGKEISWLPYITNTTGKVDFTRVAEEGCYVKVAGVPTGYGMDEDTKYTFDEEGKITIVLTADNSYYAAQIGEFKYTTWSSAVAAANASNNDVTIELLADVGIKGSDFTNTHGAAIVINGNGHTVTASEGNNSFTINQEGSVTFRNMTIKHNNTGSVVQVAATTTVDLIDVVIDATDGGMYNYCLINLLAKGETSTLNMTNVDVKMAVNSEGKDGWASVIRTGNNGEAKTVNINLTNCNLDATGAIKRTGIVVMKNTTANINLKNTNIKTKDNHAVWAVEQSIGQTMTAVNCRFGATAAPYNADPIKGYAAQIGNTYYTTLQSAADVANAAKKDTTIKIVTDITLSTCNINNKEGKLVLIDGNGKTVTTNNGNNVFVVGNDVAFKNMTVNHKNPGSIIHVTDLATVDLTDVNLQATEGKTYNWTLINVLAKGNGTTLNLNRVNATMAVESKGQDGNASIIRTGNEGDKKTVTINLTDCNFDTTQATGRCGIVVMKDTTATVNLTNSTIKTKDTFAIKSNKQDVNLNNSTVTSLMEKYQNYPIEGYAAKMGNVYYIFEEATAIASVATADTKIELVTDFTISTCDINNTNGKRVVVAGNGYTVTTNGGNNAFIVGNNVALENMIINHKNPGSAVQITELATVDLTDIKINATQGGAYNYALINVMAKGGETTLNLTRVNATMSVSGKGVGDPAVIRTGNNGDKKTVNINMTDCTIDTTKAIGRNGILVMSSTTANIDLTNSTIKTLDTAPIKSNERSLSQTIQLSNCTLDSDKQKYKDEPIQGYDAQIGNTVYLKLIDALNVANTSDEDVTIEFVTDFSIKENYNVGNAKGKAIIIDGKNHTLTTQNGNHTFIVNKTGNVEFKNMTVKHKNWGTVVRIDANTMVKLTDVVVDASEYPADVNGYQWALFNMTTSSALEMTRVTVDMASPSLSSNADKAIIRTGNNNQEKTVSIKLVDCKLDASDATERNGIVIMKGTEAKIELTGTTIKTMDVSAIRSIEDSIGQATISDDCKLVPGKKAEELEGYTMHVGNTWYVNYAEAKDSLIYEEDGNGNVKITLKEDMSVNLDEFNNANGITTIVTNGYRLTTTGFGDGSVVVDSEALLNNGEQTIYDTFVEILGVANASRKTVTIELLKDITISTAVQITNAITIEGNGHTITTAAQHAIQINYAGIVKLQNMNMNCEQTQSAIQVIANAELELRNMDIAANTNGTTNFQYGLILVKPSAATKVKMNLYDVDVQMVLGADYSSNGHGVIRTGNPSGYDHAKEIEINLEGCEWNLTGAPNRNGIAIMHSTTATVNLKNTTIATKNACPIADYSGSAKVSKTESTLSSTDIVAQIGTNVYATFADALSVANGASGDVTIELLANVTVGQNVAVKNANGKVVIDGNGNMITTSGGNHVFLIQQTKDVEFKNMTIKHKCWGAIVRIDTNTTVKLTDVVVDGSEYPANVNGYQWALFNMTTSSALEMTRVTVDMDSASIPNNANKAIIRTGNDGDTKTVTITLDDCTLDATGATERSGISVMKSTTATINLKDTSIKTKDSYVINAVSGANVKELVLDNSELTSETAEYANNPIRNVPAENIKQSSPAATLSTEEEVKTLTLKVPARLYDAFVEWIKEFAEKHGWELEL